MSTQFPIYKGKQLELEIDERSTKFELGAYITMPDGEVIMSDEPLLEPEEIIDIAMKMIQPTLYHVDNPRDFMENVIKVKLAKLFV